MPWETAYLERRDSSVCDLPPKMMRPWNGVVSPHFHLWEVAALFLPELQAATVYIWIGVPPMPE